MLWLTEAQDGDPGDSVEHSLVSLALPPGGEPGVVLNSLSSTAALVEALL